MHNGNSGGYAIADQSAARPYDTLLTYIDSRMRECRQVVERELSECSALLMSDRMGMQGLGPHSPSTSTKIHQVLSTVPPIGDSQISTLLFTPETQATFLRSALSRELFQRLKKVAKRWLANVPPEYRNQATKISQDVAQAVVAGRVSTITALDLETYRARVQQGFGKVYHIPTEELCKAFSRKIRVYLQNTKAKHDDWVERYAGLDLSAPIIEIEISPVSSPNILKRNFSGEGPAAKRAKVEDIEDTTAISRTLYDNVLKGEIEEVKMPIEAPPATTLYIYQQNIVAYYEQNKESGFPPALLTESYFLLVGYCVHNKIFDVSIQTFPELLLQTCVDILPRINQANNINCTIQSLYYTNTPGAVMTFSSSAVGSHVGDITIQNIRAKTTLYSEPHNVLCTFVDFAISEKLLSNDKIAEWLEQLCDPNSPIAESCLVKLGVLDLPASLYSYGHRLLPTVLLLIYTQLSSSKPATYTPQESMLHELFQTVSNPILNQMFSLPQPSPNMSLSLSFPPK